MKLRSPKLWNGLDGGVKTCLFSVFKKKLKHLDEHLMKKMMMMMNFL